MKHSCIKSGTKTALLQAWVTPEIKEALREVADHAGLSMSAWLTMTIKLEAAKTGRMLTKVAVVHDRADQVEAKAEPGSPLTRA